MYSKSNIECTTILSVLCTNSAHFIVKISFLCTAVGDNGVHSGLQRAIRPFSQYLHVHRAVDRRDQSRGAHPAERVAIRRAPSASHVQTDAPSCTCAPISLITNLFDPIFLPSTYD